MSKSNKRTCCWIIDLLFHLICFIDFSTFEGLLNLKHLTKKIVSQNYQLNDSIEKIIFKKFYRVTKDTNLGLVSRILEIEEFVAVVDEVSHPIGIISYMQLLNFIASKG